MPWESKNDASPSHSHVSGTVGQKPRVKNTGHGGSEAMWHGHQVQGVRSQEQQAKSGKVGQKSFVKHSRHSGSEAMRQERQWVRSHVARAPGRPFSMPRLTLSCPACGSTFHQGCRHRRPPGEAVCRPHLRTTDSGTASQPGLVTAERAQPDTYTQNCAEAST